MPKKFSGFTLIELLVAISILAILSTVGLVSFQSVRNRTLDAKVRADLDSIKKAYEQKFDPSGNGGQGAYLQLQDSDFASGKIPTPPSGGSYFLVGPNVTGTNNNTDSFLACQPGCTAPSPTCQCSSSTGGTGTPSFLIGEENTPGTSCQNIKENNSIEATDGVYYIKPAGVTTAYQVYCDMTTDGGGWTLLIKSDGNTPAFEYSSSYWTVDNTLNANMTNFNINTGGDAKYSSYNNLPITQIRATWPTLTHNLMMETVSSQTALNLLKTKTTLAEGTVAFTRFQSIGLHNYLPYQSGKKAYGFNLKPTDFSPGSTAWGNVRWGWLWNNEANDFNTNDASSGIGLQYRYTTSVGGWTSCCSSLPVGGYPKPFRLWGK